MATNQNLKWGEGQEGGNVSLGGAVQPNWYEKYGLANVFGSALTLAQENYKNQMAMQQQAAKDAADMARTQAMIEGYYKPAVEQKKAEVEKLDAAGVTLFNTWVAQRQQATTPGAKAEIDALYGPALKAIGIDISTEVAPAGAKVDQTGETPEARKKRLQGMVKGVGGNLKSVAESPAPWLAGGGVALGSALPALGSAGIFNAMGAAGMPVLPAAAAIGGAGALGAGMGRAIGGMTVPNALMAAATPMAPIAMPAAQSMINNIPALQGKTVDDLIQQAFLSIMRNQQK